MLTDMFPHKSNKFVLHVQRMKDTSPIDEEPSTEVRKEASAAKERKKATFKRLVADYFDKQRLHNVDNVLPAVAREAASSSRQMELLRRTSCQREETNGRLLGTT